MLRLRPFKACDAEIIASWCKDEITLRKWSADRFGEFPICGQDIIEKYTRDNGDCPEADNFYPMTAFDESGIVGHLILRFVGGEKKILRFGFVIVDDEKRGCGYGKEMLMLALRFAFDILKAEKVTLGVFDNNMSAYHCYRAVGFSEAEMKTPETCNVCGETWNIIELEKDCDRK